MKWMSVDSEKKYSRFLFPPGPPKEPKNIAQYSKIESIGSTGSVRICRDYIGVT